MPLGVYNVRGFGAKGDGKQFDTEAVQRAIDACAADGGGVVYLPKGEYLSATLVLKNNVNLHLAAGARILATGKVEDYATRQCILFARDARQIAVTGPGIIDGRGKGTSGRRYRVIRFERCRDILLADAEFRDSSEWCTHLSECQGVRIHGVRIDSAVNGNNDGFDIDSCQDVVISDCHIRCGDDAIALKTNTDAPCRNITVTNCVLSSRWAAFRFGPEARGNFENITVSNCVIHDTFGCGIKLQMNEGAQMKDILFDNLVMENVTGPISLRLANWVKGLLQREGNESRPVGKFQNVFFNNIRARIAPDSIPSMFGGEVAGKPYPGEQRSCISITGVPGHPIQGISLSNIHVTFPGGGTALEAARRDVPDMQDTYPEYFMFGILPAYGLYAHHVRGLSLNNVRFELASQDLRPALVCDDIEDLELSNFQADGGANSESLIRLQGARRVFIHGSRPLSEVGTFLRVEGGGTTDVGLAGNDLRLARKPFESAAGAAQSSVAMVSNLGKGI